MSKKQIFSPQSKSVYSCLVALTVIMVATSPIAAQGISTSADGQTPAQRRVVVRADSNGKLVTRVVTSRSSANHRAPDVDISRIVSEAAQANGVDPLLIHSVIRAESAYNPFAVSSKGAQGLMQLMPATARTLGVRDSFDAKQNIEAGVRYLKQLQDQYHDDRLALAAYNAGPKAVEKYGNGIPPYPETQNYVRKVGDYYVEAQKAAGIYKPAPHEGPVEEAAAPLEDTHPKLEQFVDEYGRLHLRTAPR